MTAHTMICPRCKDASLSFVSVSDELAQRVVVRFSDGQRVRTYEYQGDYSATELGKMIEQAVRSEPPSFNLCRVEVEQVVIDSLEDDGDLEDLECVEGNS